MLAWLLSNPTRRRIVEILARGPTYLLELSRIMTEVTQTAILKHLRELERRGIVESFSAPSDLRAPPRKYYRLRSSSLLVILSAPEGAPRRISPRTLDLLARGEDYLRSVLRLGDPEAAGEYLMRIAEEADRAAAELRAAAARVAALRDRALRLARGA